MVSKKQLQERDNKMGVYANEARKESTVIRKSKYLGVVGKTIVKEKSWTDRVLERIKPLYFLLFNNFLLVSKQNYQFLFKSS